jgi:hypothetical protein
LLKKKAINEDEEADDKPSMMKTLTKPSTIKREQALKPRGRKPKKSFLFSM